MSRVLPEIPWPLWKERGDHERDKHLINYTRSDKSKNGSRNELLQTSNPDIYATGDVASFCNAALGNRIRVGHEDNANTIGALAGKNMAGAMEKCQHLPFF